MKEQKSIRNISLIVGITGMMIALVVEYLKKGLLTCLLGEHEVFYSSIFTGVAISAFFSALIAQISYTNYKHETTNMLLSELIKISQNLALLKKKDYKKFVEINVDKEKDYVLTRFKEIVNSCEKIRANMDIQKVNLSNKYIDELYKEIQEVGQYSNGISRDIRCAQNNDDVINFLKSIFEKAEMFFDKMYQRTTKLSIETTCSLRQKKMQRQFEEELNKMFENI